jgi:hypothetical protein
MARLYQMEQALRRCWYNYDKKCTQPRDCQIADRCLDCWNPAEVLAMREGALWFWLEPKP